MKNGIPWRVRKGMRSLKATPKPTTRKVAANHNPHAPRGIQPWVPLPQQWRGRTFHIVGGGPSLKNKRSTGDMSLRSQLNTDDVWIAVNNSYKLATWADILHFADCEWWRWNGAHVLETWPKDRLITTATSDVTHVNDKRIKRFWRDRNQFTKDPAKLHGWDSGTQAVNLAYHLGAAKIVLWGIDMRTGPQGETQWHKEHKRETNISNYAKKFAPSLAETVRQLGLLGVPVVRATDPGIPEAPYERQVEFNDKHD